VAGGEQAKEGGENAADEGSRGVAHGGGGGGGVCCF
jgi:hypothetical protein